jgi:hypothetical protein
VLPHIAEDKNIISHSVNYVPGIVDELHPGVGIYQDVTNGTSFDHRLQDDIRLPKPITGPWMVKNGFINPIEARRL